MPEQPHEEWRERIDSDVRSLSERMAGVEAGMTSLGRSFDRFSHSFENSSERQRDLQKTQWPVIFGALTLVVIVIGGFMSGYVRDLNRVESSVSNIKANRISWADPGQDLAIEELQRRVIQYEKTGRGHRTTDLARGADHDVRVKTLEREVVNMRKGEHEVFTARGRLAEQVRALERKVFDK